MSGARSTDHTAINGLDGVCSYYRSIRAAVRMHTYLERKKVVGEAAVETRCRVRSVVERLFEPVERLRTAGRGNVERTQCDSSAASGLVTGSKLYRTLAWHAPLAIAVDPQLSLGQKSGL